MKRKPGSLTLVEQLLVNDFLKAAKALPKSICFATNEHGSNFPVLDIHKRIKGTDKTERVASLNKKSLNIP